MCQKLCNGCFSSRLTQFFAEDLCSWELLEMLRYDWKIYLKLDCLKELDYSFFKCEYLKWRLDVFNEGNTHWLRIDGVDPGFLRKENFCRFFIPIRLTLLLCWEFAFISKKQVNLGHLILHRNLDSNHLRVIAFLLMLCK